MRPHNTALLLLLALVAGMGWLFVPLGVLAAALLSVALVRVMEPLQGRGPTVLVLVLIWAAMLALVLSSGLTIGAGGRRIGSLGGTVDDVVARALIGLVVPVTSAALLLTWGGLVRTLALVSLFTWAAAVIVIWGATNATLEGGFWTYVVISPVVIAYGLALAAAALGWRTTREAGEVAARPAG